MDQTVKTRVKSPLNLVGKEKLLEQLKIRLWVLPGSTEEAINTPGTAETQQPAIIQTILMVRQWLQRRVGIEVKLSRIRLLMIHLGTELERTHGQIM